MGKKVQLDLELQNQQYTAKLRESQEALRKFGQSAEKTGGLKTSWVNAAAGLSVYSKALEAAKFVYDKFLKAAMDGQEQMSKFNTIFKGNSAEVSGWADVLGESIGRSSFQLKSMAADMMALTEPMASTRDQAVEMSKGLVEFAQDLSSFHNVEATDALADLKSMLAGSTETMLKYGIVMTEAALQEYALTEGITKKVSQMSIGEKTALRYNMAMAKAGEATGDAARTMDSSTNQIRQFEDGLGDLARGIGDVLLPALNMVVKELNQWIRLYRMASADTQIEENLKRQRDVMNEMNKIGRDNPFHLENKKRQLERLQEEYTMLRESQNARIEATNNYYNEIDGLEKKHDKRKALDLKPGGKGGNTEADKHKEAEASLVEYYTRLGDYQAAAEQREFESFQKFQETQQGKTAMIYNQAALEEQFNLSKAQAYEAGWKAEVSAEEQKTRAKFGLNTRFYAGIGMMADAAAQLMSSENKALFRVGQVGAIARIGINTSEAITKGYAQLGPLGGTAFAVLMGTVAGVQVANVLKQKPPEPMKLPKMNLPKFDQGVFNIPRDMPAIVHKGETVMPKSFAESMRAGEMGFGGARVIQLQIDGRTVAEIVDDHRGRMAQRFGGMNYARAGVYK